MSARSLVPVVLGAMLAISCGEAPWAPTAPEEISRPVTRVPENATRATLEETLADPFVLALVAGLDDRGATARLDVGLRAVRLKAKSDEIAELRVALQEALGILEAYPVESTGPDDGLALAALELILQDLAESVPADPPPSEGGPR